MNIYQLIRELNAAPAKMFVAAQTAINAEARKLVVDFQRRSPIDTGGYKSRWHKSVYLSSTPGIIAGTRIFNDDLKAATMEFGAEPNTAPWYYPQGKVKTGKLTASGGKIWAGGLKPGHHLTIGGAIDPVLYKNNTRQIQIADSVATKVLKVI